MKCTLLLLNITIHSVYYVTESNILSDVNVYTCFQVLSYPFRPRKQGKLYYTNQYPALHTLHNLTKIVVITVSGTN